MSLLLTRRYLRANPAKSALLAACFAITLFLPLTLTFLIRAYQRDLTARAEATPLLLGARGDRYDLVLKSLYFSGGLETTVHAADWDAVRELGRGAAIPLHLGFSARGRPVVGTSLDYFAFRGLRPASGTLPIRLGDAVLGARAAEALGLGAGDHLISDQASLFNIAANYPLKMRVTGVLGPSGTPDDDAVFVDVKTAWVIEGIGHGHTDLTEAAAGDQILRREEGNVIGNAAVVEYNEITEENIGSFHFHADREGLPLSALVVAPDTPKDATLLKGRFSLAETRQLLDPSEVVAELLGLVFRIKAFLDRAAWLVYLLTALFTTLVVLLSLRLRRHERRILVRLGCSRATLVKLQATELAVLLVAGALLALAAGFWVARAAPDLIHRLT